MKMDCMTIRHASAMPAPTWSWLKMNDAQIEIPDGLERVCQGAIEAGDALDNTTSFEGSLAALQERLDAKRDPDGAGRDGRAMVTAATSAVEAGDALDNTTSFEGSLAALQERLDAKRDPDGAGRDGRAMVTAATSADRGAEDLDVPALSACERRAVLSQVAGDVAADFD